MKTTILSTPEEFAACRVQWNALVHEHTSLQNGLDATSTFEWFESLAETFAAETQLRLITLQEGDRMAGLLPVACASQGALGQSVRVPEVWYSGRNGLLLDEITPTRVRALIGGIDTAFPNWTELALVLTEGSDSMQALKDEYGRRMTFGSALESPHFPLAATKDAFWGECSKSTRQLVRTARNKLATAGPVECRVFDRPEDAQALLEAVLGIEQHSWKQAAGTAITRQPKQERFYRSLFPRALGSRLLFAMVLHVADQPVAYNFGLLRDGVYCCLKHSHRQDMDKSSPAYLLMGSLVDALIERGVRHFDFMGRVEPHKLRWSPKTAVYTRRHCVLYRDSLRGTLLRHARAARESISFVARRSAPTQDAAAVATGQPQTGRE